jgi:hypothetical protein
MRRYLVLVSVLSLLTTAVFAPEATASLLQANRLVSPVPASVPGMFVDRFDDGVVGPEYSPVGGASLVEAGGQLQVLQSAPGDGVLVTLPATAGGAQLWAFCLRWGLDLATQLDQPGDQIVFRAWEQAGALMTSLRAGDPQALSQGTEQVRWEIDKVDATTFNYRIYKNGKLVRKGQAKIPDGTKGFRIDKVPGTNKVIGEVLFKDGKWEKLFEKDPPEIPYEAFSLTSNMADFALDEVMAGLHTDDPNTEGAIGDLALVPFADGGMTFTPLGGDFYDVEITLEDLATFGSIGETIIPLEVQIGAGGNLRTFALDVTCRGTDTGTCTGQSSCSTKTCPDREYDIGDGNGFQTYTGTCKKATIGLPLCSCSYKLKRTLNAVQIFPGETVTAVVDPTNTIPEFIEAANSESAQPSIDAWSAGQSYGCTQDADGFISLQTTVQVTTGHADLTQTEIGSVQLFLSGPSGISPDPVPAQTMTVSGTSIFLDFVVDPSFGLTECPTDLVVLGATVPPMQYWSTVTPAGVMTDADLAGIVQALLAQAETVTLPLDAEVGTPILVPNALSGELIRMGDLAVPELTNAVVQNTLLQQAYAAYALGEIGNPSPVPTLVSRYQGIDWATVTDELELTVLQEAGGAADKLGGGALLDDGAANGDPVGAGEKKRCCVIDVDAVTSGALAGGKSVGDYRPPNLSNADGSGANGRWNAPGTQAGPFNSQTNRGAQRTGAVVQIVATLEGDRSCCTISQHYTIEQSNYDQDTAPVGQDVDDLGQAGAAIGDPNAAQRAPFRQTIGANQDSFVDYPSRQYNAPPGRTNYTRKQRFVSCYHSYPNSDPPCEWEKCCVTWVIEQTANGPNAQTTVKKIGSDCDSGG